MGTPLDVNASIALRAASVARDQSGTVTGYLESIDGDVQDLLTTWTGDAAKAYSESWDELLVLLRAMAAELDHLGERVGTSTQSFVQLDQGE